MHGEWHDVFGSEGHSGPPVTHGPWETWHFCIRGSFGPPVNDETFLNHRVIRGPLWVTRRFWFRLSFGAPHEWHDLFGSEGQSGTLWMTWRFWITGSFRAPPWVTWCLWISRSFRAPKSQKRIVKPWIDCKIPRLSCSSIWAKLGSFLYLYLPPRAGCEECSHENCTLPTIQPGSAGRRPAWAQLCKFVNDNSNKHPTCKTMLH